MGGGTSLEVLVRLAALESQVADLTESLGAANEEIRRLENLKAAYDHPGLARLCNSQTVTESEGLVLPASENNAGLDGTLANRIEKINNQFGRRVSKFTSNPADFLDGKNFTFTIVNGTSNDYVPAESSGDKWWNVLTFGSALRCTQIAAFGFADTSAWPHAQKLFMRIRHDSKTTAWVQI